MEVVLGGILSYLIGLAANLRTDSILAKLREQLEREDDLRKATASTRPLREELRAACVQLARTRGSLGITKQEEPLLYLFGNESFQNDLAEWFIAGGIVEGNAVKKRLLDAMDVALTKGGANPERIAFLKTNYFDSLDKVVFSHPVLAHWRHQLSLDYLREQVVMLRQRAEEAAGHYSPEKQKTALDRYCEKALAVWDIIDLSNLPEGDIHMATQKLLLRQLYMSLRIEVELTKNGEDGDAALGRLEDQRETRRHWEAGHLFLDEFDRPDHKEMRSPVGELLGTSRRLVVLGDPGVGKTTMLRWMATAYLLRHKGDNAFSQIPDVDTLPGHPWIPVLIRCRDLGEADLCRCFTDFLTQHLNKTELLPDEADVMRAVVLDRIAKGEVLLLVDGLDEITNPLVRMMFCQELERTAARYPDTPIVVTSRIVGYRDMPHRMGAGFEHGVIAELNREDKDLFARRWVEVTEQHQSTAEKAKRAQELLDALHSSDRIERLTGNPMLLTTLALVKRKVGKLPNRRNKLYSEAVSVLLNWNPRLYETIEEDEAIPQLEYLAHEMCRRGVQRLTDDEVLDLLEKVRAEYPNVRAIRRREPHAFLALLEARSSILIKSGNVWQRNHTQEKPVWEFRHLTFQEYLAARAILDGRYPGRDKTKSLAEQVAPLAGAVEIAKHNPLAVESQEEMDVPESWREALRLLVADCKDDDVDEVLLAILNPMAGEDQSNTSRPRSVLAALCLADEPNISERNAQQVLAKFAANIGTNDGKGIVDSSLDRAAIEIGCSMWSPLLKESLIQEFNRRSSDKRWNVGGLWGMAELACWRKSDIAPRPFFTGLVQRITSGNQVEAISAALTVMEASFEGCVEIVEDLPSSLLDLLASVEPPEIFAAAWALGWLSKRPRLSLENKSIWVAKSSDVSRLCQALDIANETESDTRRWLVHVLGESKDSGALPSLMRRLNDPDAKVCRSLNEALVQLGGKQVVPPLLAKLDDPDHDVRKAVIRALGQLGDKQVVPPLLAKLDDPDHDVRKAVIRALGQLGDKQAVPPLLAKLDDSDNDVRKAVIRALGQLGDIQAVPPLLAKLEDPDNDVREAVIRALGQLGDIQAVLPLLAKLEDPDNDVREAVIRTLGQLGDKQAVPPLLAKLEDSDNDVRVAVIRALVQLGDIQAVPPLLAKLEDPDNDVREAVIRALGQLGDKQAVPPLLAKLDDRDNDVREAVIRALGQLGDKQAVPPLLAKLEDPDNDVRKAVIEELGKLGDKQAVPPLLAKLEDPDNDVREAVIRALGKLGDIQAIEPLILRLNDPDDNVCAAAAASLTVLGSARGSALKDFLSHSSPMRREAAVKELVRLRDKPNEITLLVSEIDRGISWMDPKTPITETRLADVAKTLGITTQEVRSLYESIASDFHLKFE